MTKHVFGIPTRTELLNQARRYRSSTTLTELNFDYVLCIYLLYLLSFILFLILPVIVSVSYLFSNSSVIRPFPYLIAACGNEIHGTAANH